MGVAMSLGTIGTDPRQRRHGGFGHAPADWTRDDNAQRWIALNEAGRALALLAGSRVVLSHAALRPAPARASAVAQALEDLSALMEPGLAALLAARARGVDARAAAGVLLAEFLAARDALLLLAGHDGDRPRPLV